VTEFDVIMMMTSNAEFAVNYPGFGLADDVDSASGRRRVQRMLRYLTDRPLEVDNVPGGAVRPVKRNLCGLAYQDWVLNVSAPFSFKSYKHQLEFFQV
jgi:hypothetical protein